VSAADDRAVIRRIARRITLQTAALFTACLLLLGGLAAVFLVHAQDTDARARLRAAVEDDDAVTDPPSGITVYRDEAGQVRSSPSLHGRPLDPRALAAARSAVTPRDEEITSGGRDYLLRTVRRGEITVQAGLDLTGLHRERRRLIETLAAAGATGALIALAAGSVVARRAVRPLETAGERQRRFVADASHELRTPLAQAHTRAQLLHRALAAAADRPDLVAEAEELVASTRQLGDIVQELLLSAQLSAGARGFTPVDIADVAAASVAAEQIRAAERGVAVTTERDGGPHLVAGSPTALRRVVNSLVDNALGHARADGRIHVTVERRNRTVVCTVSDDGSGFDPGAGDALFARFSRGDHGNDRSFGLGLALVREVVVAHGGTITADSVPGQGATFTVTFPAAE
jgi:two-component system OmpR family sensor kinase